MYEENAEKGNRKMTEKELYMAAFSGLHASEKLKREEFYMKNRKPVLRVSRMAAICAVIALLVCVMSVGAYAATDGESANPIKLLQIYLNGEDISGSYTQNEDGSYDVDLGDGASITYNIPSENGNNVDYRIDVNTDTEEGSVELEISDLDSASAGEENNESEKADE